MVWFGCQLLGECKCILFLVDTCVTFLANTEKKSDKKEKLPKNLYLYFYTLTITLATLDKYYAAEEDKVQSFLHNIPKKSSSTTTTTTTTTMLYKLRVCNNHIQTKTKSVNKWLAGWLAD